MQKIKLQTGQSLMEILFAIAVFSLGVVTVGYLIIESQHSLQSNIEFTRARLLAQEGIEALRSIRDDDFVRLQEGQYGLEFEDGVWNLSASQTDTTSQFVRFVTIENVEPDVKKIHSSVSWTDTGSPVKNISFSTYVTAWSEFSGAAASLSIDTSYATLSASEESLQAITLENTSESPIVISEIQVQWDNFNTLHEIFVGGSAVFSVPIPSEDGLSSGMTADIADYTLEAHSGPIDFGPLVFNGSMSGTDFIVTFKMSDGTDREVRIDF